MELKLLVAVIDAWHRSSALGKSPEQQVVSLLFLGNGVPGLGGAGGDPTLFSGNWQQ